MIASLARTGETDFVSRAAKAANFVLKNLRNTDGRLLHRYRQEHAGCVATLDDYAFFIWGLIELYEAGFDISDLQGALQLADDAIRHYWDEAASGFFLTPDDGEQILVRAKPIYDGAVPSGNSVMVYNLLRLARLTGRSDFEEKAWLTYQAFRDEIEKTPRAYTQMLTALEFAAGPTCEIVVAGESDAADTRRMLAAHGRDVPAEQGRAVPPCGGGRTTDNEDRPVYGESASLAMARRLPMCAANSNVSGQRTTLTRSWGWPGQGLIKAIRFQAQSVLRDSIQHYRNGIMDSPQGCRRRDPSLCSG